MNPSEKKTTKRNNKVIPTNDKDKVLGQPPRRRLSIPRKNKEKDTVKNTPTFDYSYASEDSDILFSDFSETNRSSNEPYLIPEPPTPPPEALHATGGKKGNDDHGRRLIDLIQKLSIRAAMAMPRSNNIRSGTTRSRTRKVETTTSSSSPAERQAKPRTSASTTVTSLATSQ